MFTGIVKAKGIVERMLPHGGDLCLTVRCGDLPWADYAEGESIAVNGVCLTAVAFHPHGFDADVSLETMKVTALAGLAEGSNVNLEPSLRVQDRLGGHLVSGHVDCVGSVKARRNEARSVRLEIEVPAEFERYMARKGSVCIDGVSLTINAVSDNVLTVNIIPHTVLATIIDEYEAGTRVNVEVDLLARYVERLLMAGQGAGLSRKFLRKYGYG